MCVQILSPSKNKDRTTLNSSELYGECGLELDWGVNWEEDAGGLRLSYIGLYFYNILVIIYTQTSKLNKTKLTLARIQTQTDMIIIFISQLSPSTGRRIHQKINGKVFRFGMGIVGDRKRLHRWRRGRRCDRRGHRRTSHQPAAFAPSLQVR